MSKGVVNVPPGFPGNLSPTQEAKLRDFWTRLLDLFDVARSSDPHKSLEINGRYLTVDHDGASDQMSITSGVSSVPHTPSTMGKAPEGLRAAFKGVSRDDAKKEASKLKDESREMKRLMRHYGAAQIRDTVWKSWLGDDPDANMLRYLRSRNWDVNRALAQLGTAMKWRLEIGLTNIIYEGEAGLERTNPQFQKQFLLGKAYVHGCDREGRPICYINVRHHHAWDQSKQTLVNFIAYNIEAARKGIIPPAENCLLIFDMTKFGLMNMDYYCVYMLMKIFETYYPESLHALCIHNAPFLFTGIWKLLAPFLDPAFRRKVVFTNSANDLFRYIDPERLPKQLGGQLNWTWEYTPPLPGEEDTPQRRDIIGLTLKRDEMDKLNLEYETATREWISATTDQAREVANRQRRIVQLKRVLRQRELEPYARARTVYERQGNILDWGKAKWVYETTDGKKIIEEVGRPTSDLEWELEQLVSNPNGPITKAPPASNQQALSEKTDFSLLFPEGKGFLDSSYIPPSSPLGFSFTS